MKVAAIFSAEVFEQTGPLHFKWTIRTFGDITELSYWEVDEEGEFKVVDTINIPSGFDLQLFEIAKDLREKQMATRSE